MTQIIPTKKSFIQEEKLYEDDKQVIVKGHYGAKIEHDGCDIEFDWGDATRTYHKNKKWNKKLRYVKNKGLVDRVNADLALNDVRT